MLLWTLLSFALSVLAQDATHPKPYDPVVEEKKTSRAYSPDGMTLVAFLKSRGFNCNYEKPSSSKGHRCIGKLKGYPDKVNIYIPPYFDGKKTFSTAYHIHGFRLGGSQHWSHPFRKDYGEYGKYLTQSKKNALLIVPEGQGKNKTHKNVFGNKTKTARFFKAVEGVISAAGFPQASSSPIALSGHSGAYDVMNRMAPHFGKKGLPSLDRIHGVALFDSMYGYRPNISRLFYGVKKNKGHFYIAHNGKGKKVAHNKRLYRSLLKQAGEKTNVKALISHQSRNHNHMSYMEKYMASFFEKALP